MSKLTPEAKTLVDIYVLSILLADKLDELDGTNILRHNLKRHAKALGKEIEKFDKSICEITQTEFLDIAVKKSDEVNDCLN